ncbi:hypothetical protein OPQ81_000776 [Rhizoctonia solani]|nr:hypothetical protein OPQ81_000776 [Rhizoctonia solani]
MHAIKKVLPETVSPDPGCRIVMGYDDPLVLMRDDEEYLNRCKVSLSDRDGTAPGRCLVDDSEMWTEADPQQRSHFSPHSKQQEKNANEEYVNKYTKQCLSTTCGRRNYPDRKGRRLRPHDLSHPCGRGHGL